MEDGSVGAHCQFEGCGQKEFFPFSCSDCNKTFCGEHRHVGCAEPQQKQQHDNVDLKKDWPKCMFTECEEVSSSGCKLCGRQFCLNHRFEDQHECPALAVREQVREQKMEVRETLL